MNDILNHINIKDLRLLENVQEGIIIDNRAGKISYANTNFLKIFGLDNNDLDNLRLEDYIAPEWKTTLRDRHHKRMNGEDNVQEEFEYECIRKDGTRIWIETKVTKIFEDGKLTGTQSAIRDITQKKKAIVELERLNKVYAILNIFSRTFVKLRNKQKLLDEVCKIAIEQGNLELAWIELTDDRSHILSTTAKSGSDEGFIKLLDSARLNNNLLPSSYVLETGEHFVCNNLVNPSSECENMDIWRQEAIKRGLRSNITLPLKVFNNPIGYLTLYSSDIEYFSEPVVKLFEELAINISFAIEFIEEQRRRLQAELELKQKSEKLSQLIMQLQNIREEENTKVAREIHDELGQALTAIKISLTSLSKNYSNDQDIVEHLFLVCSTIDETIKTMRKISTRLRPRLLDELGLISAMEWQLREFRTRTGIRCILTSSDENFNLNPIISTALFRIFQEALTNIARHSKATNVKINIFQDNVGTITMDIVDNGVGIAKKEGNEGLGLLGMKERAHILGGEIEILSSEQTGTQVIVNVPIINK